MKNKMIVFLFILACSLPGLVFAQNTINRAPPVGLGVSQVNITPDTPTLMSGYGSRKTPYTGVHDSLYASALFFSGEKQKVLLITADIIGFSFEFVDDTKSVISSKTGIPSENIMIVATHNHGGPSINEPGPDKKIRFSVFKIGNLVLAGISGELMTELMPGVEKPLIHEVVGLIHSF